jgi:hypothetical protein
MVCKVKYRNLWTPANPGLAMYSWHDATVAASLVQEDAVGRVKGWLDRTANQNDWHQAVIAAQPTTGAQTINGLNAVGFDGLAYFMAMDAPFGVTVDDAFVCMVLDIKTVANSALFSLTGSATAANRWQTHCPYGDGTVYFDCGGTAGANRVSYAAGWSDNSLEIMGWYGSTTDGVQQVWEGGVMKAGDATGHSVPTGGGYPSLGVVGATEFDTCAVGEIIIINGTVSAYTRVRIEGYMAHKWGCQSSLHDAHPCRWAPPVV